VGVVAGGDVTKEAFVAKDDSAVMVNSGFLNGMTVKEAIPAMKKYVVEQGFGKEKVNYKLRDWVFSRQRYWGEPIPLVNCPKCGWVPIPEDQLPLVLPQVDSYEPTDDGESPLSKMTDWVNTTCPQCGGPAKRETDTMPQWAGSSWYFLRYMDPHNDKALASKEALDYWSPVDWYNGGMEHTTLHLLYSRFWHKFLYDIGVVPTKEPYQKRTSHGMILGEGGEKMSKSRGNVVNPNDIVDQYGADTMRLHIMFIGDFEKAVTWSNEAVKGSKRFLDRVWNLAESCTDDPAISDKNEAIIHKTIKKVTEDIDELKMNTAIASMMTMVNEFAANGCTKGDMEQLLPIVMEVGEKNLRCMALLDRANTESYGTPTPVTVPLTVEKGPFIVISGHDLHDLKLLLEQTEGRGINIYTHGEMLPAHGYPALKKYAHLKGNFGTAWQNQQKEFAALPAPVLFTTNCLMPPKASYADRVFTTSVVSYPELVHIGEEKDFTPVIEKALELGGYAVDRPFTGINGGSTVMTGFARGAVLSAADTVIEAVKSGAIRHFFLVAGCDGARPGRNYYTEFVKQTPADTVVLTLACGKYRFNDLDLGTIGGLPRLMDVGQCNDAYSAIQIALALANAFGCGVNELPLSMVLSWYEQKAVCILLTLLHLGIRNIRLGPTLPAFLSPNVLNYLVDNFGIAPITTPEADLKQLLK